MQLPQVIFKDPQSKTWVELSAPLKVWNISELAQIQPAFLDIQAAATGSLWALGFVSYEAASAFDSDLQTKPLKDFPLLWFGLFDIKNKKPIDLKSFKSKRPKINFQPQLKFTDYQQNFDRIKSYIQNGQSYQVNYTFKMQADFKHCPREYFIQTLSEKELDYAFYLETQNFAVLSLSPELFFEKKQTILTAKPMKGTIKRGLGSKADAKNYHYLQHSSKERAENVMILDMLRNDLGQIAEFGSVEVLKTNHIEKYSTAWQMISEVRAKTNADLFSIYKALFPGASITGAPKRSSMQIIKELEQSPRKIYTGTIGWINQDYARFSIAIRTLVLTKKTQKAEYGTGGGIVWESLSQEEYAECILKSNWFNLQGRKPDFGLLETLLWDGQSYYLIDAHIQRLTESANYWDIPLDVEKLKMRLKRLMQNLPTQKMIVRVLLGVRGSIMLKLKPFVALELDQKVSLAYKAIDLENPLLFHKTTKRRLYKKFLARAETKDVLLFNSKGELTESTVANLALKINGKLYTPPLNCGLLPGTMRAHLLEKGSLTLKVLKIEDLAHSEVFLLNSVRGIYRVKFVPRA